MMSWSVGPQFAWTPDKEESSVCSVEPPFTSKKKSRRPQLAPEGWFEKDLERNAQYYGGWLNTDEDTATLQVDSIGDTSGLGVTAFISPPPGLCQPCELCCRPLHSQYQMEASTVVPCERLCCQQVDGAVSSTPAAKRTSFQ